MNYTHLTQSERYQISILAKAGHNRAEIARLLNRHKSTISREILRNTGKRGYRPKQAHVLAAARAKACCNAPRVSLDTWSFVTTKLAQLWSPEQIAGYLAVNGLPTVSHESIYRRIYSDKQSGGIFHLALRCQKSRRKRYGVHERRGSIPNQISIDRRPAVVATRERFGDWEADLMIGAGHKQALVTINERRSRYALIAHIERKESATVADSIISLLTPFKEAVHTITTDNGKEFANHERVAKSLGGDYFFAHPYASWERGANENMNGLIRQFFPKKFDFRSITPQNIATAMNKLNHRPRKCLGFKTPHEVFMKHLQSINLTVALQG